MDIGFTEQELKDAKRYVSQMESMSGKRSFSLWILPLMTLGTFALVIFMYLSINSFVESSSATTILAEREISIDQIGKYLDMKGDLLRAEMHMYVSMIVFCLFGGLFLGLSITKWLNRNRQTLLTKALRHVLSSEATVN